MSDLNNLPTLPQIKAALPPVARTKRDTKFNAALRKGMHYARLQVRPVGKRMWNKEELAAVSAAMASIGVDGINERSAFGFQVDYLKRGAK